MKFLSLIAFFATLSLVYSQNKNVVCYYQGSPWSTIAPDPTICTHMMYAFFDYSADGTISAPTSDNFAKFMQLRTKSPALKLLASVGGADASSLNFKSIIQSSTAQTKFANEVKRVITEKNLDGIDIDYEPAFDDRLPPSLYTKFISVIKQALPAGKLLTIAVFPDHDRVEAIYEPLNLSNLVDFINLMTYDFHGAWGTGDEKVTYYQSPLRQGPLDSSVFWKTLSIEACANLWAGKQVPRSKLMLGVPLYGKTYTLANPLLNGVGALFIAPGEPVNKLYNQICFDIRNNGWTERLQSDQAFHYAFKDRQWVSYENIDTVGTKAQYVKDNNYGGIMFWSLDQDDFSGACRNGNYPLIRKAFSILVQNVPPTPPTPATPATTTKSSITTATTKSSSSGNLCVGSKAGLFAFSGDCSYFWSCDGNGGGGKIYCGSADLGFNPATSRCDWKVQNGKNVIPNCT